MKDIIDKGGRRSLFDRRRFPTNGYFPENRASRFRRREGDRRKQPIQPIAARFERRSLFIDRSEEEVA